MAPDVGAIVLGRGDCRRRHRDPIFSAAASGTSPTSLLFLPSVLLSYEGTSEPRAAPVKNAPRQLDRRNVRALNKGSFFKKYA